MPRKYPHNKRRLHYRRKKNEVEMDGDPADVKGPMWFDLILASLPLIIATVALACKVPEASFIPIVLKWLLNKLPFLILLPITINAVAILLSG